MKLGVDVLLRDPSRLRGKRVAILSHQAGLTSDLRRTVDVIPCDVIFGPEHGFWGVAQDMEGTALESDEHTSKPIVSLYEKHSVDADARELCEAKKKLWPDENTLREIDVLVVDLQDVGARYYTFANTMAYCMEVAKRTGTQVLVLDRPNPINGVAVEGNLMEGFFSFVGQFRIPVRHGMTIGELARFFQLADPKYRCDLDVVTMEGWKRPMWWDETGVTWVPPSPNMPTLATAVVYPGMCLIEATELSEGRGTTTPFELFGGPGFDPFALAQRLNDLQLPGALFRPQYFKPTFQKHAGKRCGGVQLHVLDRDAFEPYRTGLWCIKALAEGPGFAWRRAPYEYETTGAIHQLTGTARFKEIVENGNDDDLEEWIASWHGGSAEFERMREGSLLY
jgi:uncharacterized protein YbbC (DUF1343 family)